MCVFKILDKDKKIAQSQETFAQLFNRIFFLIRTLCGAGSKKITNSKFNPLGLYNYFIGQQ
jgi:hypothetical protein